MTSHEETASVTGPAIVARFTGGAIHDDLAIEAARTE
jgi:hypothetical protein